MKPSGQLSWTGDVNQTLLDLARAHGKDLGPADWWEAASRPANADDVRVALRYGLAATGGIVVDARHVVPMQRPAELRALAADNAIRTAKYRELPQVKMVEEYLEHLGPGHNERSREIDRGVAESLEASIEEADEEAADELAAPVSDDLVQHWQLVGGIVPDPL